MGQIAQPVVWNLGTKIKILLKRNIVCHTSLLFLLLLLFVKVSTRALKSILIIPLVRVVLFISYIIVIG